MIFSLENSCTKFIMHEITQIHINLQVTWILEMVYKIKKHLTEENAWKCLEVTHVNV